MLFCEEQQIFTYNKFIDYFCVFISNSNKNLERKKNPIQIGQAHLNLIVCVMTTSCVTYFK
jgi:hypothetical protein